MKFEDKKRGYTLAEIMLVILILTIVFAAFAPIFTKRKITQYTGKYNVWDYADRTTYDAFYNPGDPSFTGQLFFGLTPESEASIQSDLLPLAKIVIRSGEVTSQKIPQHQIQFRYGRNNSTDAGKFAGSWFMNRRNTLLGGSYGALNPEAFNSIIDNVAIGFNALDSLSGNPTNSSLNGAGNTAVGYNALKNISTAKNNVAVGSSAGSRTNNNNNVFVGYNAGKSVGDRESVIIGSNAASNGTGEGIKNLYIGANAGKASSGAQHNTAVGYNSLAAITSGKYNTAIGYNALSKLTTGDYNVAIGANACSEVTTGSYKTCIGANSGPRTNSSAAFLGTTTDTTERVYIGGQPTNYGGDAVLELHNPNTGNKGIGVGVSRGFGGSGVTLSNTTTVINGNLIVRGRPYFTTGKMLQHFHDDYKIRNNGSTYLYGYSSTTDSKFASCSSDVTSYNFNSKCQSLNTGTGYSDRRLKNISSRNNAGLEEINKLKIYNYTFKNDDKKLPHVGVMAQDLLKVFPNSVFKGNDGFLRIKWDEMFYATINAIKELDRKIIALVKRTTTVETQISKLEKENILLKSQVDNLTLRINKLKAQ